MKTKIHSAVYVCFFSLILNTSFSPAQSDLFPEMDDWKLTINEKVYTPANLWDLINGAADMYLSYGFVNLHLAEYTHNDGTVIKVELYRHSSKDNAFGIYTTERSPDYNYIDVGVQGYLEEGVLNYLFGDYYIKVTANMAGQKTQHALMLVAERIQDKLEQESEWPGIYTAFPEGIVPYSEHYTAENFLGFAFLHSAFSAEYVVDNIILKVFIIKASNIEEAKDMLKQYFDFTKQDIQVKDGHYTVHDKYNGDVEVLLRDNYLAGIVNSTDQELSWEMLKHIDQFLTKK